MYRNNYNNIYMMPFLTRMRNYHLAVGNRESKHLTARLVGLELNKHSLCCAGSCFDIQDFSASQEPLSRRLKDKILFSNSLIIHHIGKHDPNGV